MDVSSVLKESLMVLAIAGTVSALKTTIKLQGWMTVSVAIIIGAFAGIGGVEGLNIFTGVLTALAAIGTYSLVDRINPVNTEG